MKIITNNNLMFKRLFSATNLAKDQSSHLRQQVAKNSPSVKETPSVIANKSESKPSSPVDRFQSHKLLQLAQSRATQTTRKLASLLRGPVRSNLLVSWELLKLVAAEQKLIPELSTWPQARQSYISVFESFKNRLVAKDYKFVKVNELTWGQVARALRVSAEMASFYYIGELIGMISSFPFK